MVTRVVLCFDLSLHRVMLFGPIIKQHIFWRYSDRHDYLLLGAGL